jgi:hypothetical protein
MMAVRGQCAVVDVAGSRRCRSTTCDVARYTGRIEVRSGAECYREGRGLLVLTMHVDGATSPFIHWSAWACICSSSGAHICLETRVPCVLRWALVVTVCVC